MLYDPATYGCQFALSGIVINGSTDAAGCDWILTKESGWFGSPAIKTARVDKPAGRGLFRGNEFRGGRVMTLEGTVSAPSTTALRAAQHTLFGICPDPHVQYPLTCTEESGAAQYANVVLDGEILTVPISAFSVTFTIQLVAPDPRKFSTTPNVQNVPLASIGSGGVLYPVLYPVNYGTPGNPGSVALTNNGTTDADPVFVFTGPLTSPSVTRADTGDTLTYNGTLTATDTLSIDSGTGAVLLDGINRRAQVSVSNWFSVPGKSTVTVLFRSANAADTGLLTASIADTSF